MKNADTPINGTLHKLGDAAIQQDGLTKREYFSGLLMQAHIERELDEDVPEECVEEFFKLIARYSVQAADALLEELERTQ